VGGVATTGSTGEGVGTLVRVGDGVRVGVGDGVRVGVGVGVGVGAGSSSARTPATVAATASDANRSSADVRRRV